MASAPAPLQTRMSVELFRQFVADRSDKERWELIDGVAMMMAPPTLAHQCIASNLQLLLNRALESHSPTLVALQTIGVNIAPTVEDYDPEPDVVVIDHLAVETPDERYADRFYLVAEIVSQSDRVDADRKRAIYKLHETCTCILTVQQERVEVRVDLRSNARWTDEKLTKPDDLLVLPDFGLRCKVSDIYRGTPLAPRQRRPS